MRLPSSALLLMLALAGATAAADDGRFVARPAEVRSDALRELAAAFEHRHTLSQIADELNAMFVLPRDIGLRLAQCDQPNAFYDSEATEIRLCLELIDGIATVLQPQFDHEDDYADALAGAFIATALHEAGHALVDVLELPITGREEDAVDQLAAWLLIEAGEATAVLGAAATYDTGTNDADAARDALAGEHPLDRQRYFNHLCWVYGSAPQAHRFLIDDWQLPEARAGQCAAEYALIDRSWTRLLAAHLRRPAAVPAGLPMASPASDLGRPPR